ncbi:serine--tRNA ligase [Robiginitomaculum antarcticum]|uniref:serine--tRNA ligase n=1 Tax=Robiginitomaculum antarcticum TaxID=437507 RepID=UPI00036886C6|nr:serine--tRNA ligase [Robiginitomaculum antarcticum]
MHDIKAIRENPDAFDKGLAMRGLAPMAKSILDRDAIIRKGVQVQQEAEAARNAASKKIGQAMAKGDREEAERLKTEVSGAKNVIAAMGAQLDGERAIQDKKLAEIPNIPFDDVPEGASEDDNVELRTHGTPRTFDFAPKDHADLGEALGLMDFETAAKMSGARFVILSGKLARLERALGDFMLDQQTEEGGFTEVSPPLMVRENALFGTGQLPKFEEDLYSTVRSEPKSGSGQNGKFTIDDFLENTANDFIFPMSAVTMSPDGNMPNGSWDVDVSQVQEIIPGNYLIPTAEVSLTNIVRESIVEEASLPRRYVARTPCFRSEAGSAGQDTKGMIRQHQFIKVELVSISKPEESEAEHTHMLGCAENILRKLDLPYRVIELCTGDLGFGARRTFDLEVWLPSQDRYREISSVSNCGDFQARRMNARYKHGPKDNRFVHTLNGSGLAVGRALVAVLENYQNADGSITVPDALIPYMGGITTIG